jgi:t-SNARE complex subunit (syntaxin)
METSNHEAEKSGVYKDGTVATDLRIRKSQHSQLTKAFVKIMTRYNDVQAENKKKYTESVRRQCQVGASQGTEMFSQTICAPDLS